MIRIASEQDLLNTFRPVDRDEVQVTADLEFPLTITDYKAWLEPNGHRVFLIYEDPSGKDARGIVFKRGHPPAEPSLNMCEWCHSVRGKNAVGMLTAAAGRNKRVGIHLCRDLSCKENLVKAPGIHDLRETVAPSEKVLRLVQKMSEFSRRNLF